MRYAIITALGIIGAMACSGVARAEVITGYNGITIDTSQAQIAFGMNDVDNVTSISPARVFNPGQVKTGYMDVAYDTGKYYLALRDGQRGDKVLLRADWGPWKWTQSPKPTDGEADRCTTIAVSKKKYRVKNTRLTCTVAAAAVKSYVATGKAPKGFRCATTGISKECQNTSITNDNAAAYPDTDPYEQRLQGEWANRMYLCGTSDTYSNVKVYALNYDSCEGLGDEVNTTTAALKVAQDIVQTDPLPDDQAAFIPSPLKGTSCRGGLAVLFCGVGDNCLMFLGLNSEDITDGIRTDVWKYGRFAYRTADYRGCFS